MYRRRAITSAMTALASGHRLPRATCRRRHWAAGGALERRCELCAGADAELAVDLAEVELDRLLAEEELGRHVAVRRAAGYGFGHAQLGGRETVARHHEYSVDLDPYADDAIDNLKVSLKKKTAGGWSTVDSETFPVDTTDDNVKITEDGVDFGDLSSPPRGSGAGCTSTTPRGSARASTLAISPAAAHS